MAKPESPTPTFRIKLLHERKSGAFRKIDGMCGARYVFNYDEKLKAYAYAPKTEAEASDIFATVGRTSLSAFGPVSIPAVGPATKEEAVTHLLANPEVAAKVLADYRKAITPDFTPPSVEQIEECIVRGIVISEDDSAEVVARLLEVARKTEERGAQRIAEIEEAFQKAKMSAEANKDGTITFTAAWESQPTPLTPAQQPIDRLRSRLDQLENKASHEEAKGENPMRPTPAQKRLATMAAKKAAQTKESPDA